MSKKQKIIKTLRLLGMKAGILARASLKKAFDIRTNTLGYKMMADILKKKAGIDFNGYDRIYYRTNWETWEKIIQYDWTDKKKYLAERYDCDNFAGSLTARMAEIYDLNSAGEVFCTVYDAKTGEKIANHLAVIVITSSNKVYLIESQNDGWTEIRYPEQNLIIRNWKYKLAWAQFN